MCLCKWTFIWVGWLVITVITVHGSSVKYFCFESKFVVWSCCFKWKINNFFCFCFRLRWNWSYSYSSAELENELNKLLLTKVLDLEIVVTQTSSNFFQKTTDLRINFKIRMTSVSKVLVQLSPFPAIGTKN